MLTITKGQSAGMTEKLVFLSTPPTTDASFVGELFEAHRRRIGAAVGLPLALEGRDSYLGTVFPASAVPSFRVLGGRMELGDIAAMDAVEGRAPFASTPASRFAP